MEFKQGPTAVATNSKNIRSSENGRHISDKLGMTAILNRLLRIQIPGKYSCNCCRIVLDNIELMQNHLEEVHSINDGVIKCFYCTERYKTEPEVEKHIKTLHPNLPFKILKLYCVKKYDFICPFCKYEQDDKDSFNKHLCIEFNNKGYCCLICQMETLDLNVIRQHMADCHEKMQFREFEISQDVLNRKVAGFMENLKRQFTRRHINLFPETFRQPHNETIVAPLHFDCTECDAKFAFAFDLNAHLMDKHFKCSVETMTDSVNDQSEESNPFNWSGYTVEAITNPSYFHDSVSFRFASLIEKQKREYVTKLEAFHNLDNLPQTT